MKKKVNPVFKTIFWFSAGWFLGLFFFLSFFYIFFKEVYKDKVYPGVKVVGQSFSGKTKKEVQDFFDKKNQEFERVKFSFKYEDLVVTISAKDLKYGFNSQLLAEQAYDLGRSGNFLSDVSLQVQALLGVSYFGLNLNPSYSFSDSKLTQALRPLTDQINKEPVDALFNFQNGRVIAFRPSSDGQEVDLTELNQALFARFPKLLLSGEKQEVIEIPLSVVIKKPKVQTQNANNFGIKELLGQGSSRFAGSIPNRIYNIGLAASKFNGLLVPPDEIFSFNEALGDVSKFTGYKEAFVIKEGRTVLGDGGGVCQVSTTFFRAILNSGLPIIERHPHSYRVGYYEQDLGPGFDATVYAPSVDLKFKNDTQNYILIQTYFNPENNSLTFALYGTTDGRQVTLGKPIITNVVSSPAPKYTDDPTLPRGVIKQIDFAAPGADVSFTRTVERNDQVLISEKFFSGFRPWQAVFLRGTN